jgi:ATP-dependent RNA helicase DeaD
VINFSDFSLLPAIKGALDSLGFTTPTEIQEKIIPTLLENYHQDVHAQAQTGTGKTFAFGIPLLHAIDPKERAVQALIIAPTRELVLQIYESLRDISRDLPISIEPIYGGMPINRQIAGIKKGAHIIVGTPGRLIDHLQRKTLSLKGLKVLVLDEADIMLEMGFKEEVDKMLEYAPAHRNIWLFSATVLPGIKDLIRSHMKNVVSITASKKNVASPQINQYYAVVQSRKRMETVARFIEAAPEFYGIIFCQTKILTTEVMEELSSRGLRVNCLHGDMKQALRNHVIKGFKSKDFNILVATDVAARGIDVSDLTHVINFSLPDEHETYIHRIGRTGRAGKGGIAIVLVSPSELYRVRRLEKLANVMLQEIQIPSPDAIISVKMSAVSDFIEQSKQPSSKFSPVHNAVKELINSFSEDEIKNSFAMALEERYFKDILQEEVAPVRTDGTGGLPQEICMEVGQETGHNEDMIRDYLYTICKLLPQEISKVRVLRVKTFISVPEQRLHDCIGIMKKNPLKGGERNRVYLVEDVQKESSSRGSKRSSDRGGHFGGRRGSRDDRGGKRRPMGNRR